MEHDARVTARAAQAPAQPAPSASAAGLAASSIPALDFGVQGAPLHFLHANGYPPACYQPLISRLAAEHHVFGLLLRPLWPEAVPASIEDWRPFSDDLLRYLHELNAGPVIGMGHSIGATVTLRAALQEPSLFRALALIDPVLVPPWRILQLRILRALGLPNPLNKRIDATLRRRRHFDDLDKLFAGYRQREVFRFFSDEGLRALIGGITRPSSSRGYDLAYSPDWEARVYQTAMWRDLDIWNALSELRIPILAIRGAQSDTFWEATAGLMERRNRSIKTVTVPDATHLVALERPAEVAQATGEFLKGATSGGRRSARLVKGPQ